MTTERRSVLSTLCTAFGIALNGHDCIPFGNGLINQTFLLKDRLPAAGAGQARGNDWILQQVNTSVFKRPELIAYNNYLAAEHLRSHHPEYRFMRGRRTIDGKDLFTDPELGAWRVFPYFQNTVSYDGAVSPAQAFSAAQQFGRLTRKLEGVYVQAFKEVIPGFHDLVARFAAFRNAVEAARPEQRALAKEVIAYYLDRSSIVDEFKAMVADPEVRTRITHNDTKLNNVLFDKDTDEAVCVIDLDTLMPGKTLFDLGDMIRTFISPTAEDDPDPAKAVVNEEVYAQLVAGYVSEMAPLLSRHERERVHWSGRMLLYEQGIRFLTDFLQDDVYYRTTRVEQNLDRAKNQMHLLTAFSARERALVERTSELLK
jgi:thiamine kinase-like enzyme